MANATLKVGVDGAAEYQKAIKAMVQENKTLASEMKLVASEYDKNSSSAKAHKQTIETLNKQISAQESYVAKLKERMASYTTEEQKSSTECQKLQENINKASTELNTMRSNLDNVKAEPFQKAMQTIGTVAKTAAVALAAMAAAAAKAAVELGKAVVENYAEYEQLAGGVEKLFGEASDTVTQFAEEAYKAAGMSANEYMETVTGFSASLISSLGGDTEKAAELSNQALIDMSDNANTFGTDIESVKNAYQGFAKQTYTMLDNLKLGYGGTKTEMERLLSDANAYNASIGKNTDYQIDSYADIINAIHDIQTAQGIAGTTALEAENTIEGSMNTMKAAYTNFLTGLGDANADMEALTSNLASSFESVFYNITPVIQNIVNALPVLVQSMMPIITGMLPTILETAMGLFTSILDGIVGALPQLIPVAAEAILTIVGALVDNLPTIVTAGIDLVLALAEGIANNLETLLPAVVDCVIAICDGLISNIDKVIIVAGELLVGIITGLATALPKLIAYIPQIIKNIVEKFKSTDWKQVGKDIMNGIKNGITSMVSSLVQAVKDVANSLINAAKSVLGIASPSKVFASEVGKFIPEGISLGIDKSVPAMLKDAKAQFAQLETTLPTATSVNNSYGGFTINVNASEGQSAREIADEVMNRIQFKVSRKEAVW